MNAMWQMWQQRYNKDLCQKIVEEASKIEPQDAIIGFQGLMPLVQNCGT